MSNDGFKERRVCTRFPVHIEMVFSDPAFRDQTVFAQTCDISACGLGLLTEKQLLPGIELNIALRMRDNGEEVKLKGEVVWTSLAMAGKYRVGVKLEQPYLKPIPLVLRVLNSKQM